MSQPVDPRRASDAGETGQPGATRAATSTGTGTAGRRANWHRVNWLLALPLIGVLIPQFYNHAGPDWGGMPFFYWYQLIWVPLSAVCSTIVYYKTRGER